jgi:hypothetical protein
VSAFCPPYQPQGVSGDCYQNLVGLQRLSDPYAKKVVTLIPTLAGEAKFTLSPIEAGAVTPEELGLLSKWLGHFLRSLSEAQIKADIYGGHAQLLLSAPGDYWSPIENAQWTDIGVFETVHGLVADGDSHVSPGRETNAIHSSRVMSVPSRGFAIAGQDWQNVRANIRQGGGMMGLVPAWSATSWLDSFWAYWEPYRRSLYELKELMMRKDFLLLKEENLDRTLENSGEPEDYLREVLATTRRVARDEGVLFTDAKRDAQFVTRSLQHVAEIHEAIRVSAIGASGLTESTLFNFSLTGGGLAAVDLSDRLSIQSAIKSLLASWMDSLDPFLAQLGLTIEFNQPLELTPIEIAEIAERYSKIDDAYVAMGAITPQEARTRLEGGWTEGLTLGAIAASVTAVEQLTTPRSKGTGILG